MPAVRRGNGACEDARGPKGEGACEDARGLKGEGACEDARGPKGEWGVRGRLRSEGEGAGEDACDKEWNAARMAVLMPAGTLAVWNGS
jgi:hypothetical protein